MFDGVEGVGTGNGEFTEMTATPEGDTSDCEYCNVKQI